MAMNGDETKPPAKILWMKLPGWADDVPENHVLHMTEDTAIRYKIPLTPYTPNNKEKGRKIVLVKKSDIEKVVCTVCGQENDHFSFQCPNDDPGIRWVTTILMNATSLRRQISFARAVRPQKEELPPVAASLCRKCDGNSDLVTSCLEDSWEPVFELLWPLLAVTNGVGSITLSAGLGITFICCC
ncbi:hypothetical protein ACLB2K_032108 [Fragaria x ananassa]